MKSDFVKQNRSYDSDVPNFYENNMAWHYLRIWLPLKVQSKVNFLEKDLSSTYTDEVIETNAKTEKEWF